MSIGLALREARGDAGLSVEEAAWRTRIRPEYLRALENDDLHGLGEAAFARGYVMSYARFLGLETAEMLRAFDREHGHVPSPIEHLDRQVRVARRPKRPRWLLAALAATAALIAVSAVGLVHGPGERPLAHTGLPVLRVPRLDQPQPASRGHDERGVFAAPTQTRAAPIALTVLADARCWVRIVADGTEAFAGALEAKASRTFTARSTLAIELGNAGGVRLLFNGTPLMIDATGVWRGTFGPGGLTS